MGEVVHHKIITALAGIVLAATTTSAQAAPVGDQTATYTFSGTFAPGNEDNLSGAYAVPDPSDPGNLLTMYAPPPYTTLTGTLDYDFTTNTFDALNLAFNGTTFTVGAGGNTAQSHFDNVYSFGSDRFGNPGVNKGENSFELIGIEVNSDGTLSLRDGAQFKYTTTPDLDPHKTIFNTRTPTFTLTLGAATAGDPAAGAVPEAASWAMMIVGMGAIGFTMRRSKVATRVSYAA